MHIVMVISHDDHQTESNSYFIFTFRFRIFSIIESAFFFQFSSFGRALSFESSIIISVFALGPLMYRKTYLTLLNSLGT